eukprot:maker-scaffold14_size734282-snap-gene-2.22 protein:Tk11286 transcript:maker-scaffold14_size734282-snap-gene-2.22-mRNA-1 annotation:"atp-dependent rna helicase"
MSQADEPQLTLNLTTEAVERVKRPRPEVESTEEQPPGQKRSRGGEEHHLADGTPQDFISSLFNHNPDIPQLEAGQVEPLHEAVFTGHGFDQAGIHPHLVKNLLDAGMVRMTQVQALAIPVILAGQDALIKSQTGSGKTLAYAVPILHKLQAIRPKLVRGDGAFALVVVPTRELAIQSFEWIQKLCRAFTWIVPGMLLGGEKKKSEKARVRKGINILVSTPGRLIDHIQHTECLSLKRLMFLVLDEADRMLELGYERDVQAIITAINEQMEGTRQTLLLSATLTTGIEQLSEVSMKHPKLIDAAVSEENHAESLTAMTTPDRLKQAFLIVPAKLRLVSLASFILWKCRFSTSRKMLIFMSTQDMVDFHTELFQATLNAMPKRPKTLSRMNLTHDARSLLGTEFADPQTTQKHHVPIDLLKLHGNMNQSERSSVFKRFREAEAGLLLCTDVAARGLDLPQVDWIVQYNPPTSKADYVHRVGRTARIGAKGSSLIFLLPSEANFIRELEGESLLLVEMTLDQVLKKLFMNNDSVSPKTGRPPNTLEEAATDLQMRMESLILSREELHQQATQAYVSFIRSYASYPRESRDIFCFKELHLGHIAKSFALRDPPSRITGIGKGHWVDNEERKKRNLKREEHMIKAQKKRINQKSLIVSEYSSGLDGIESTPAPVKKTMGKKPTR